MVQIDPTQLGLEFGSGAVIGGLIGFATKKVAKVLAVLVGLQLAMFRFLETKGYVSVRWDKLSGGLLQAGETAGQIDTGWLNAILSTLSIGVGFTGGFMLGFKRG